MRGNEKRFWFARFGWKESKRDPTKLKSHSADDEVAHGARRCEKSGLANEISDRSKGYANRRGSELSQLPFAEKSICVQLGRFGARNRVPGGSEREGSVTERRLIRIRGIESQKTTRNQVQVVFFVDRIPSGPLLCCCLHDAGARRMCVRKTRRRGWSENRTISPFTSTCSIWYQKRPSRPVLERNSRTRRLRRQTQSRAWFASIRRFDPTAQTIDESFPCYCISD